MNDLVVWQNSQVPIAVKRGDGNAVSATLIATQLESSVPETFQVTAPYVENDDGEFWADLSLSATETAVIGVYEYMVLENFDDEDPIYYPDPNNCEDGECEKPTITICESIPVDEVS